MSDVQDKSYDELLSLQAEIEKALAAKKDSAIKEAKEQILAIAKRVGIEVQFSSEKAVSSRKGRKVEPKYQNPHNPSETWTGQGRPKKWLQKLLDEGHKLEEYLILK